MPYKRQPATYQPSTAPSKQATVLLFQLLDAPNIEEVVKRISLPDFRQGQKGWYVKDATKSEIGEATRLNSNAL